MEKPAEGTPGSSLLDDELRRQLESALGADAVKAVADRLGVQATVAKGGGEEQEGTAMAGARVRNRFKCLLGKYRSPVNADSESLLAGGVSSGRNEALLKRVDFLMRAWDAAGALSGSPGLRDVVAAHVDEVTEQLLWDKPEPTPPDTETQSRLEALRVQRGVDIQLQRSTSPRPAPPEAVGSGANRALQDFDAVLNDVIEVATATGKPVDEELVKQAISFLRRRLLDESSAEQTWTWVWRVAAILALAAVVAAFGVAAFTDGAVWVPAAITVAGVGALLAAVYTYGGSSGTVQWRRWLVVGLPFVVLVLAFILPGLDADERVGLPVLAVLAVTGLIIASIWLVRTDPTRRAAASRPSALEGVLLPGPHQRSDDERSRMLVLAEVDRLRGRIQEEARRQQVASRWWAATFILVGGLAALLSGAAGVSTINDQLTGLIAPLAIAGAGLSALATALNPGRRWEQARTLRLACESLEQEVRVKLRVDLLDTKIDNGRALLDEVAIRYDALIGVPERKRLTRKAPDGDPGQKDE